MIERQKLKEQLLTKKTQLAEADSTYKTHIEMVEKFPSLLRSIEDATWPIKMYFSSHGESICKEKLPI